MTDKQIIIDEINKTIEQKMENLRNIAKQQIGKLEAKLKAKEQELKKICKALDIEYAIDEETGNLIGRCNKLYKKEQECEELKKDLHQNFKEKDKLHLIIDRLLEASGYDTNTASAEDFEDVYENMRYEKQQLDQLKAENKHINDLLNQALKELEKTRETLTEIKEIAENVQSFVDIRLEDDVYTEMDKIL